jgi:hypothetical protein
VDYGFAPGSTAQDRRARNHFSRRQQRSDNVAPPAPQPALSSSTFIPTPLVFSGMPNTRWWEFEERQTNFGRVTPDTTDLGKLLLLEFGLVYANDWFVFPYTLPRCSASRRGCRW